MEVCRTHSEASPHQYDHGWLLWHGTICTISLFHVIHSIWLWPPRLYVVLKLYFVSSRHDSFNDDCGGAPVYWKPRKYPICCGRKVLVLPRQSWCQWVSETSHCFPKIAEQFSFAHKNMPAWFHLISDHRLCSRFMIRKYFFWSFCASNIILWLRKTIHAMLKQQGSEKF